MQRDPLVYLETPNEKLFCKFCNNVYLDPVITQCGHTFCRECCQRSSEGRCPIDDQPLQIIVKNIAMDEQVQEVVVRCKYGIKPSYDGLNFEADLNGCLAVFKLADKCEHEKDCEFLPTICPNNPDCPTLIKKDLEEHLTICQYARCLQQKFGCSFIGTSDQLKDHLKECRFESMKEVLIRTDEMLSSFKEQLSQREEETEFLRSMLAKLSERVEILEIAQASKMQIIEDSQKQILDEFQEVRKEQNVIYDELTNIQQRLAAGTPERIFNPFDHQQVFRCVGTFVGHQGPVWCLHVHGDLLFSGSADRTIKVWDVGGQFRCIRTLTAHEDTVLSMVIYGNRLYSGANDKTIIVWDLSTFEPTGTIDVTDNPICTLAAANGMIFGGSLKSLKVWNVSTLSLSKEINNLNHWVRAIETNMKYVFAGSHECVKVYDVNDLACVKDLETSGGGAVYSIAISDQHLLCGMYEHVIYVWSMDTFQVVTKLSGHTGAVYGLGAWRGSVGTVLFSASHDRSLRVWSMENMICKQTLIRHQGSVACLALSKGRVFSGSVDSTVKVWQ